MKEKTAKDNINFQSSLRCCKEVTEPEFERNVITENYSLI
jgi:hypothetical protein